MRQVVNDIDGHHILANNDSSEAVTLGGSSSSYCLGRHLVCNTTSYLDLKLEIEIPSGSLQQRLVVRYLRDHHLL